MSDHVECRDVIRGGLAEQGVDAVVSTATPIVSGPYEAHGYTCPHGTTYWVQPTGEQIAAWNRDGTP